MNLFKNKKFKFHCEGIMYLNHLGTGKFYKVLKLVHLFF